MTSSPSSSSSSKLLDASSNFGYSLLPGASVGVIQAVIGHPFDTIKTKAQDAAFEASKRPLQQATSTTATAKTTLESSSSFSVAAKMYKKHGIVAFYRGVTVPLAINATKRSLQYSLWDKLKEMQLDPFVSGAITGAAGTVVIGCPAHVVKIHSQVSGNRNALEAAKSVYQTRGLVGFYAGLPANLAKDVIFASVYLGLYERYKNFRPAASYAESATVASVVVWMVFMPVDTIKTIFQSPNRVPGSSIAGTLFSFSAPFRGGTASVCWSLLRRGYAGFAPALMRAGPANAASMSAYEWTKEWCKNNKNTRIKTS